MSSSNMYHEWFDHNLIKPLISRMYEITDMCDECTKYVTIFNLVKSDKSSLDCLI